MDLEDLVAERVAAEFLGRAHSLVLVLVANAVAFLAGVRFYVDTMPAVPTFLWPIYADSPTAVALATLTLASLSTHLGRSPSSFPANRPLAWLHTFAICWLVKYGLWTAVALNLNVSLYIGFDPASLYIYWGILLTHLLFVGEALLLAHYARTTPASLATALGVLLVGDVADYWFGLHPPLRYEPGLALPAATVLLSLLSVAAVWRFVPTVHVE